MQVKWFVVNGGYFIKERLFNKINKPPQSVNFETAFPSDLDLVV
jgi:hypothetical protein